MPNCDGFAPAVAGLPKPSLSAAALNELVREDPSEIRALLQSGKPAL